MRRTGGQADKELDSDQGETMQRAAGGWVNGAGRRCELLDATLRDGGDRHRPGKWDFRLSAVSLAMIVDELGLRL